MARSRTPHDPPRWTLDRGVRLQGIRFVPGSDDWTQDPWVEVGRDGCKSITVQMENGQMAAVPWARVVFEDGEVTLVNLAQVLTVVFAEPFPADEDDGGEAPE